MKLFLILFASTLILTGFSPTLNSENQSSFYIGRSRDTNIIKYDINLNDNGEINLKLPIVYYWIKNTKGGKIERLTPQQDKLAYGIKYLVIDSEQLKFQFVSYPHRTFTIKKNSDGIFKITTYVNEKAVELKRIHIEFGDGTFFVPKIKFVNMYWKDIKSGKEGTEVIIP